MSKENTQVLFSKRPFGVFDPKETFTIVKNPIPTLADLKDGQLLVKAYYLSLDPAMRGWMNSTRSYIRPVEINEIMRGQIVGEVVLSKNPKFKVGDKVQGFLGWQEYALTNGQDIEKITPPPGASLRDYVGIFGGTGMTAYFGLLDGKPKPGDTVVVSGAAGATGSTVGQIAKIKGARVIGIAGSEEKCNWLVNDLGFDIALNYRDPEFASKLAKATPQYIDIYFDNVGGDILDHCLKRIAKNGRIVLCGAISQYNEKQPKGPAFYTALITQRAKMEGFIIFDYAQKFPIAIKDMAKWLQEGKIKRKEYIIDGLENAPNGLLKLFNGYNTGKMLVKVNDENVKSKL
ncbi:NADP-dependent leukotriene B4 12-hydroxydehydrogenase [Rhizophagus irregularis]|uniref:NADP-dependent leukotriene B4 12-hydroxydehydrogenase n=1 Tax=Rhizophagus irregularis TaxID=588596 RepID=A0A2N1NSN9_9GLOM|nr:NADP-dependent leukotriene B4 12-hydroxydehydrogenase [Rhizophagus irregularis]